MAISQNVAIGYFGTQDALGGSGGSVSNNTFSLLADLLEWVNDDDAPEAIVVLKATWSLAPDIGGFVNLHHFQHDIGASPGDDSPTPTADFPQSLGTFLTKPSATTQFLYSRIRLPNVKTSSSYNFFLENKSGQTINSNWDLLITPRSVGPHA